MYITFSQQSNKYRIFLNGQLANRSELDSDKNIMLDKLIAAHQRLIAFKRRLAV